MMTHSFGNKKILGASNGTDENKYYDNISADKENVDI